MIWQKTTQAHVKAKSCAGKGRVNRLLSEQKCPDGTGPFSWWRKNVPHIRDGFMYKEAEDLMVNSWLYIIGASEESSNVTEGAEHGKAAGQR